MSKPAIGKIEVVTRDQNIAAVLFKQRPAATHTHPVREERTEHTAKSARHRDDPQIELSRVNQITGERHDYFRRQRNARRFNRHKQDDAAVTKRRDGCDYER